MCVWSNVLSIYANMLFFQYTTTALQSSGGHICDLHCEIRYNNKESYCVLKYTEVIP